jgi:hypothetical protein
MWHGSTHCAYFSFLYTQYDQSGAHVALSEAGGSRYSKITESLNCEKGPDITFAVSSSSIVGSANFRAILSIRVLWLATMNAGTDGNVEE